MIPSSHHDIHTALEDLEYDEIQSAFSPEIFYRGVEYCEEEAVANLRFVSQTELEARVLGSSRYNVQLAVKNGKITGECDCPYDRGPCKHIAAVLLSFQKKFQKNGPGTSYESVQVSSSYQLSEWPEPENRKELFKQAEQLSKKELVDLLIRLAPEPLKKYIAGKNISETKAQNLLEQVKSRIETLFRDDELLCNPSEFDLELSKELETLSGLQDKIPGETGDLLLDITGRINELLYEGYLDDYYNDDSFSGDTFYEFVRNYAVHLPFTQKVNFLDRLQACFDENEWYSRSHQALYRPEMLFDPPELPELKNHIFKLIDRNKTQKALIYFDVISDHCTDEELEQMLLSLHTASERLTLKLAELYKKHNRQKEAIIVLEKYLSSDTLEKSMHEGAIYSLLIDLKHETGQSDIDTVFRALKISPDMDLFRKAVAYFPDQTNELEAFLENRYPSQYISYLESGNRLQEALLFVQKKEDWLHDDTVSRFYKRHGKIAPDAAIRYFTGRIDRELEHTGEYHYITIADSIRAIRGIDSRLAADIVEDLRKNYKRRRNLMKRIAEVME